MGKVRYIFRLIWVMSIMLLTMTARAYAAPVVDRLAADDRYGTAIEVSKAGWGAGTAQYAIVATGEDFKDALCAAPLARKLNAPILLNGYSTLDVRVSDELNRLGVKNVYIVGGTSAISEDVAREIKARGISCTRVAGSDMYETAIEVAKLLGDFTEIVVAGNESFPDVLSIAPIAAKKGMPIILTPNEALPENIADYLKGENITKSYIIGGTDVVSNDVVQQLGDKNPKRIYGEDRYGTNVAILNEFSHELNYLVTYIATGENFPDALAGAAVAPLTSSPILLVNKVPAVTTKSHVALKLEAIARVKVLGGEGAVASSTLDELLNTNISDKYNDFSLRYDANFRVKVYNNVNWVPANALGKPRLTREQISNLVREPEVLKKNINTLYDAIQYIRTFDFKSADDNVFIEEDGYTWEHHKPGTKALLANGGSYASISNMVNYLLKDDYEEVGFIHYFQEDGTGYGFNYFKQGGKYYVVDLTHYRNDFRYTAIESGNLEDYYNSDYVIGNVHEAASLEDYAAYCRTKFSDPAEIYNYYSLENMLPTTVKKVNGSIYICYPADKKDDINVIYDSNDDGIYIEFLDNPKQYPSWI